MFPTEIRYDNKGLYISISGCDFEISDEFERGDNEPNYKVWY